MKIGNTLVYLPPGSKINVEGQPLGAPKVKYEKRKKIIDIDATKKVVGGKYGQSARYNNT